MHTLGLLLVSMVGFSTGCVIGLRKQVYVPSLWDLLAVIGVWVLVFGLADEFGRWSSLLFALIVGITVGVVLTLLRAGYPEAGAIPESELPEHARERAIVAQLTTWQRIKKGWASYGERMGNVQGRLLMGFFYFIVVLPFGLIARITSDPLTVKRPPTQSAWAAWDDVTTTLEQAQEQG